MTTKHTPGPWQILAQGTNRPNDLYSVIGNTDQPESRQSIVCNSCDIDDARLIAAAPELLAALQAAQTQLIECQDQIYGQTSGNTIVTLEQVTAAIAKATK